MAATNYVYSFEKLQVWQNARELNKYLYSITTHYPAEEKFGMVSQIRRAANSVMSNIAEGSSRSTKKDQAHFYNMAYSSNVELLNHCIISFDLNFINIEVYQQAREKIELVSFQLNNLRKAITK